MVRDRKNAHSFYFQSCSVGVKLDESMGDIIYFGFVSVYNMCVCVCVLIHCLNLNWLKSHKSIQIRAMKMTDEQKKYI